MSSVVIEAGNTLVTWHQSLLHLMILVNTKTWLLVPLGYYNYMYHLDFESSKEANFFFTKASPNNFL